MSKNIHIIIILCILILPKTSVEGQQSHESHLQTPTPSRNNSLMYNIWLSGSYTIASNSYFWLANNTVYSNNYKLNNTHLNISLTSELFFSQISTISTHIGLGYQNEWYSFDNGKESNGGVNAHWITIDGNIRSGYFMAGVKAEYFLGSHILDHDHFSYVGINSNCFNTIACCYYVGLNVKFTYIIFEGRIGGWLKPSFNPNRLAYYNLSKTYIDGLYWELGLSIRLFSSGNKLISPSIEF